MYRTFPAKKRIWKKNFEEYPKPKWEYGKNKYKENPEPKRKYEKNKNEVNP